MTDRLAAYPYTDADRRTVALARAVMGTNAAVRKLCELVPLLVIIDEDDPLMGPIRDALQLIRLSDDAAAKAGAVGDERTEGE